MAELPSSQRMCNQNEAQTFFHSPSQLEGWVWSQGKLYPFSEQQEGEREVGGLDRRERGG